jgi:hypothetical protein
MNVTDEMLKAAIAVYHDDHHYYPEIMENMRDAIAAAMQAAWVSVDDRLPDLDTDFDDRNRYAVIQRGQIKSRQSYFSGGIFDFWDVSHWMQMPEHRGD